MDFLSEEGRRVASEVAARHGVSADAVAVLLRALAAGGGSQAQFNHPDLGGMGQWSRGGMVMVGDMFNNGLKARVDALCTELSGYIGSNTIFARPTASQSYQSQGQSQGGGGFGASLFVSGGSTGDWWPEGLGSAGSVGAQNNLRYAFFPGARRLAIDLGGRVTVYDTGDHQITGFSQQQGGDQSLTFTSQYGLVRVADLPVVRSGETPEGKTDPASAAARPAPAGAAAAEPEIVRPAAPTAAAPEVEDIFGKLEKLAKLHERGILSAAEFEAKKSELLARI